MHSYNKIRSTILTGIKGGFFKLRPDRSIELKVKPAGRGLLVEVATLLDTYGVLTPTEVEWLLDDTPCPRCTRLAELRKQGKKSSPSTR